MATCIQPAQLIGGSVQFPFFYHMTHKDNLAGILEHGILSHARVFSSGDVSPVDISDPGAQRRRERPETANHRAIHDYAPLYINPRNPMLYKRRSLQHAIVILKISPDVLHDGLHVFCDGNAASRCTRFSRDSDILADSIDVLNAEYWNNLVDGKRRRCAELLVYPGVRRIHILSAICSNKALAMEVAQKSDIGVEIAPSFFF